MTITFTDRLLGRAKLKKELENAVEAKQIAISNLRQMSTKVVPTVMGVQRLPAQPKRDLQTLSETAVQNEMAFACINIRATSLATPKIVVQRRNEGDTWEEEAGHELRALLMRPNAQMSEAEFFAFASTSLDACGVFYCEVVRSRAGLPVALNPLDPVKLKPQHRRNRDGSLTLTHYEWRDGIYKADIAVEDMLVRHDRGLSGYTSRLAVAMGHVDADNAQTDYIRAFFNNAGVPSGIINIKNRTITQEESDAVRSQWRAKYGRQWGNQHDVAVFDENAEYQRIGSGLHELDSETMRGVAESRISMVFHVPPLIIYSYIGLTRATYSNLDEAWAQFWKTTMTAVMRGWRDWLTRGLLLEFEKLEDVIGEQVRLHWNVSDVTALNEDTETINRQERLLFRNNMTTLDEARERVGLPPYPDAGMGSMNYDQVRAASSPQTVAASSPAEEEGKQWRPVRRFVNIGGSEFWRKSEEQEAAVLSDYEEKLKELTAQANNGEIEQEEFERQLLALAVGVLLALFLLGSLIRREDLTDAEKAALVVHIEAHQTSAKSLGDDIYSGRYGEDNDPNGTKLLSRIALWLGGARRVLTLGRAWRRDDPMLQWRRDPNKDSCEDCIERDGMVKPASVWREEEKLPRSTALKCHGDHCGCDFYEVTAV